MDPALSIIRIVALDSRILMLKMGRDRLSKYQRKIKKGGDKSSTDGVEDDQCRIIMESMEDGDDRATYKEMNKLAEMTMERIINQYLVK